MMQDERLYRHEYKYLVSNTEIEVIKNRIKGIMKKDPHAVNGIYNIRSLYFDDYDDSCLYENINGTGPKMKYRIRIYNHDDSRISLECKHRDKGKTFKEHKLITKEECVDMINGKYMSHLNLIPRVIVEYDRIPFVYNAGNVRVTFDTNLSSSTEITRFLEDKISRRPVMPLSINLMEVKWDEFIPDYIYKALEIDNLQQTTYSKYYLCREYSL